MRNGLTAFIALAALMPGAAAAGDLDAGFDILRKGERIGFHAVNVEEAADGSVRVETRIEMQVKIGPIPVFRYEHLSSEVWRGGVLQSLESTTDNNGKDMTLKVSRSGDALIVDGSMYKGQAPGDAVPSSYWNKAIIGAKTLLDTQNGRLIDVKIEKLGATPTPAGAVAEQHRLSGTVDLNLWYDGAQWVGADFVVRGQALAYRLVDAAARDKLFARLSLGNAQESSGGN